MRAFLAAAVFCLPLRGARRASERAFNPEALPPSGDFPYLGITPLRQLHAEPTHHPLARAVIGLIAALIVLLALLFVGAMLSLWPLRQAHARDIFGAAHPRGWSIVTLVRDDGRYAHDPLKAWFDQLASEKGLCCSFADGTAIRDVDWDTGGPGGGDGIYRVRLHGDWIAVPPSAVVTEPNRFGPAVVWPYFGTEGETLIRCFLPGAGA